jgi:peroxiredoxin Q/BCP
MADAIEAKKRRTLGLHLALPPFFFAAPFVTGIAPRLSPLFLGLLGIALVATAIRRGTNWRALLQLDAALAACLVLATYLFVNALLAVDRDEALGKVAIFLGVILVAFASTRAIPSLSASELRRCALTLVAGAVGAGLYLLLELLSDGLLTRGAMNLFAVLKPETAKHIAIQNGKVMRLNLSEFNQNAAIIMLGFWPGVLILSALDAIPRRIALTALFAAALAVPIALSEHDSSQVALVLSAIVLVLAFVWRSGVIRALAILWCLGFALVIPLDLLAYKYELHQESWLPNSARARIIIWQYTAERVLEHPWIGIGVNSTPAVKAKLKGREDRPEGFVFKRTTGQHAHDVFLQIWYEIGAIGVLLAAIAGALITLRIRLLPLLAQPYGAACFMAVLAIAAFAWSMWQTWFMCAIGLVPVMLRMAAEAVDKNSAGGTEQSSRGSVMNLEIGDKAPGFTLPADGGGKVSLLDFKGKPVVLYFYPKDDTPGCTAEACAFRDQLPDFSKLKTPVVGISRDSTASHDKFKTKYKLPFPLAADEDGKVCEAYGVWTEKSMYGKKYMGIERSTFLVDGKGIIRGLWRKVKVPGHVEEVLEAAKGIK